MNAPEKPFRTVRFGDDHAVFSGEKRLTDALSFLQAQATVGRLTKQAKIAALLTARPCLCCRVRFSSAGPHNRLCDRCRGSVAGLDRQMVG